MFNETLKLAFRERPGISWINAGKFTIKTQRHRLLLPGEWSQIVKPSMTLLMSVVLPRNTYSRASCPSCGASNPTALLNDDSDLAQVQCRLCSAPCSPEKKRDHIAEQCHYSTRCFVWYSVSSGPKLKVADDERPDMDSLQTGEGLNKELEDIKNFKRLDVVIHNHRLVHRSMIRHI